MPLAARGQPAPPADAESERVIDLTLESAVNFAIESSYRVEQLKLGIQRSRSWLRAERAGLRSRVYADVTAPNFQAISDTEWNSNLGRNEIVRQNSRMWRANLSVRQPVVLFGWPTNGYLSLNSRVYRYAQGGGDAEVSYYNRYFVKFEQPFFQPNELKNDIRDAELELKDEELNFKQDLVDLIDDIADDYYDLFELAYRRRVYRSLTGNLEEAKVAAQEIAEADTTRAIEASQLQVELGNAQEQLSQVRSNFRLQASQVKQRLRLSGTDSLHVVPTAEITPIRVDEQQAISYGQTLRPRLQELEIQQEQQEIALENTGSGNSFHVDLEVTYGREMQNVHFRQLFDQPTNSYTVGLNAHIPIWDWGRRDAQKQARQISLQKTKLYTEETKENIRSNIQNAIRNVKEYQRRATNLRKNLKIAQNVTRTNLWRYRKGRIRVLDLIQSIDGQKETAMNFLNAYLGYREALLSLQRNTYYDFEKDLPVLERFSSDALTNLTRGGAL